MALLMRLISKRALIISGVWYAVPFIYVLLTLRRYFYHPEGAYQLSVLRHDWALTSLARDLWTGMYQSVAFWRWLQSLLPLNHLQPTPHAAILRASAVAVFLLAGAMLLRWSLAQQRETPEGPDLEALIRLLVAGVILLIMSFPAYLLLGTD